MSEENFMPFFQPKNIFTTEVRGQQHTYYLTGPITEPENYVDLCNILRSSGPQDEILIRINSRGGSVASERMVINAIQESEANVVGFIEYDCMSAATGIFLACKQHGWAEHIQFMAHCAFWGSVGKNPDVKSQTEFGIKQLEEEITSTYKGLLTDEEVLLCNDGKEFWFGAKELATRMENFYEYQKSLPCDCGSPECQANQALGDEEDFEEMPTLEDMISSAVTSGIAQYEKSRLAKEAKASKLAEKKPSTKTLKALEEARIIAEKFEGVK